MNTSQPRGVFFVEVCLIEVVFLINVVNLILGESFEIQFLAIF
jgi:hypothetical protein